VVILHCKQGLRHVLNPFITLWNVSFIEVGVLLCWVFEQWIEEAEKIPYTNQVNLTY